MLFVARLSWHFAQSAEAHDAYLVTELGNLFTVEDRNVIGGNNTNLNGLNAGVTQALLSFMAGITEESVDFMYLTGTGSIGDFHEYSPFFAITPNVVNSSSGYVGLYGENDPHTSVPIPSFFTTYRYSNSSNTLHDIGYSNAAPTFDSVEITAFDNTRLLSGAVSSWHNGFYLYNTGTYAVKLHPGLAYHVPNGMQCVGGVCDRAAIISSDSNLMGATSAGLRIGVSNPATVFTYDSNPITGGRQWGNGVKCAYYVCIIHFDAIWSVYNVPDTHISSSGNLQISVGPTRITYDARQEGETFHTQTISTATTVSPVTTSSSGRLILTHLQGSSFHIGGLIGFGDDLHYEYLYDDEPFWTPSNIPQDIAPYMVITGGPSVTVHDRGIPLTGHVAYWANNQTDLMYRDTATVYNPSNVVVNANNMYMVIEKNTVGSSFDVEASNITNSALEITDLPPNTVFTFDSSGGNRLFTGVTSGSGEITIPYSALDFSSISGLTLNLFHDSLVFRNFSGMTVVDPFNGEHFNLASSKHDNVLFTITKYVDLPIPLDDTDVAGLGIGAGDCDGSKLHLDYLDGSYNGGDNILIPIIPGFDRVCYDIGGKQLTLKFTDIDQDSVGYGETAGGTSDKQGSRGSGTVSTSYTTPKIDVTVVNQGTVTFVVEGAVQADTQISYRKGYHGPLAGTPGTVTHDNPFTSMRNFVCDGDSWRKLSRQAIIDAIDAADNESGASRATSSAYVDLVVQNNGVDVLTQRIYSTTSAASTFPVTNAAAQSYVESLKVYIKWNSYYDTHWFCAYKGTNDENQNVLTRWTNNISVLCSPMTFSPPHGIFMEYFIRLCHAEPASSCGYDVSHTISNGIFTETLDIPNVEIGDVLTFEMRGGVSSTLDDFECFGVPDGNESSQGSQTFRILTPSVSIES